MCACMRACVCVCVCMCVCVRVCVCVRARACVCVCVVWCAYVCLCVNMYVSIYITRPCFSMNMCWEEIVYLSKKTLFVHLFVTALVLRSLSGCRTSHGGREAVND